MYDTHRLPVHQETIPRVSQYGYWRRFDHELLVACTARLQVIISDQLRLFANAYVQLYTVGDNKASLPFVSTNAFVFANNLSQLYVFAEDKKFTCTPLRLL